MSARMMGHSQMLTLKYGMLAMFLLLAGFFAGSRSVAVPVGGLTAREAAAAVQGSLFSQEWHGFNDPMFQGGGAAPTSAFTWLWQAGTGALLLAAGAMAWRRRLTQEATADWGSASRAHVDAKHFDRKLAFLTGQPVVRVPRNLTQNPYGAEAAHFTLEQQVRFAIEASMRAGRVIGVIHFQLDQPANPATAGDTPAPQPLEAVAAAIRERLRSSDHVRLLNDRELAVFISLLAGQADLVKIARRLHNVALSFDNLAVCAPGAAIYPLHGYSAGELIDTARQDSISKQRAGAIDCQSQTAQVSCSA